MRASIRSCLFYVCRTLLFFSSNMHVPYFLFKEFIIVIMNTLINYFSRSKEKLATFRLKLRIYELA